MQRSLTSVATALALGLGVSILAVAPAAADGNHHQGGYWGHGNGKIDDGVFLVKCYRGESIQEALDAAESADTVIVKGDCTENVSINKTAIRLIAHEDGASITGPDTTIPTVRVRGSRARITGFKLSGGSNVVQVQSGGSATIESNEIFGANGTSGILVTQNSYAFVGGNSASLGNNIHDNPNGVNVRLGSGADVFFNTISNNDRGVSINNNGAIDIADNVISGGDRGLSLTFGGTVSISGTPSSTGGANTFSNLNSAIYCRFGGAATGGSPPVPQIDAGGVITQINPTPPTSGQSGCHISSSVQFAP